MIWGRLVFGVGAMAAGFGAVADPRAEDAVELAPIVVTAQKTAQDERNVPMSITVLDGDKLARARIDTTDDISRYAANVHFERNFLFIRGVGSPDGSGFEPSVGVFIDGIYYGRATAALMPLLDIEQVEVIRGPQGTLLGKNTIGGALSLTTAQPGDEFAGNIESDLGSLHERAYKGAMSIPLHDDFALRLAMADDRRDGYLHNSTLGIDENARVISGGRAKLAWRPSGPFSAWLSLETGNRREDGFGSQLTQATPESLTLYRLFDPATETDRSDFHTANDNRDSTLRRRANSATLNGQYRTDTSTFTWLANVARASYRLGLDADFGPAPLITETDDEKYRQWSQELRVDGHWKSVDYIAGFYYLHSNLNVQNLIVFLPAGATGLALGASPVPAVLVQTLQQLAPGLGAEDLASDESRKDFRQADQSSALFGQATWSFADRWGLTAGLRWNLERKRVHAANEFQRTGLVFTQLIGEETYDEQRERREKDFSPKLALLYEATPDLSLYASFARGYKGGGYNDFAPSADALEFEPERSGTLETGLKALLLDHRLSLNLSLFSTDYENLQIASFDGLHFVVRNAANARIHGAELESRWRISGGWSSSASIGYLDARYRSFPNAPPQADPSVVPGTPTTPQDLTGRPLQRAPKWSGTLGMEYVSSPFGPELVLRTGLDAFYRSRTFLGVDLDPVDSQAAYWQLNAALRVGHIDGGWSLNLVGQNLTNQVIVNESADVPLFNGTHWGRVDAGRTWTASAEWKW